MFLYTTDVDLYAIGMLHFVHSHMCSHWNTEKCAETALKFILSEAEIHAKWTT